jgi:hypothetical protein
MGGNVLGDLHDGKGTSWTKTPDGQYYPNCDCHGPESLRSKPAAADGPRKGKRPSGAVVGPLEGTSADQIDDTTALRLLATWLKRLSTRKDDK